MGDPTAPTTSNPTTWTNDPQYCSSPQHRTCLELLH
jgi:hypothetical protein